ncbi:hypothetical protein BN873_p10027 [Candidatus Competibacter denitrificans Run_A_D11]|uniref:Uncharacterized protein n=1 Tax=Candidatus Competibacter denitrificans Run_A_D11 TaxID=1400863 RepID=W6MEG7_9GAMM|nr:hypothetical protein BN873_p10027 [Candidatus Competibacter denitrificans Run_A_D11]
MWITPLTRHAGPISILRDQSVEQILNRPGFAPVPVGALEVLAPVVAPVAARAERRQMGRVVVGGILIQMSTGQDRFHQASHRPVRGSAPAQRLPSIIKPFAGLRVQPAAAGDHQHRRAVFATAPFTAPARPLEFDPSGQRPPVGGVEGAKIGVDGHDHLIFLKRYGVMASF